MAGRSSYLEYNSAQAISIRLSNRPTSEDFDSHFVLPGEVGTAKADASREKRMTINSIVLDWREAIVRNDCSEFG